MAKLVTEEPVQPVEVVTLPVAANPEKEPNLEELAELLGITGELLEEVSLTAEAAAGAAEAAANAAQEAAETEETDTIEEEENSSAQSSVPATPVLSDAAAPETQPPEEPKHARTGLKRFIFG